MAEDREWIEEPAEAAGDAREQGLREPGSSAAAAVCSARGRCITQGRGAPAKDGELPVAAGFFMGIALYVTVGAVWWGLVNSGGGLGSGDGGWRVCRRRRRWSRSSSRRHWDGAGIRGGGGGGAWIVVPDRMLRNRRDVREVLMYFMLSHYRFSRDAKECACQ